HELGVWYVVANLREDVLNQPACRILVRRVGVVREVSDLRRGRDAVVIVQRWRDATTYVVSAVEAGSHERGGLPTFDALAIFVREGQNPRSTAPVAHFPLAHSRQVASQVWGVFGM